jgi:hypothetical protein
MQGLAQMMFLEAGFYETAYHIKVFWHGQLLIVEAYPIENASSYAKSKGYYRMPGPEQIPD